MQTRYVRIRQLATTATREGLLPVSAATIWRWTRDKKFPQPVKLGAGTTAWPVEAIEGFLRQREGGSK